MTRPRMKWDRFGVFLAIGCLIVAWVALLVVVVAQFL